MTVKQEYSGPGTARRLARGFTLLELMVTLTVAALLLTIGVPSYLDVVRNNRAAANANDLVSALAIARSEAIRRGARVSVCRSADGASCAAGGSWAQGWIVVADSAATDTADPVIDDPDEDVLRVWSAPGGTPAITLAPGDTHWVRFLPRGMVRADGALPLTFTMKIDGCANQQGRSIALNALGRTTVARVACP